MRLSDEERMLIKKAFHEIFHDGHIFLFGSRVDDAQLGGDIDLYLVPTETFEDAIERKVAFLIKLDHYIGEQKIDVIIAKDSNRLIEKEALATGVKL